MIIFDYECVGCGYREEKFLDANRADDWLPCPLDGCGELMFRLVPAPFCKVVGRADGNDRNDADRFTADTMGIRESDLPPTMRSKR